MPAPPSASSPTETHEADRLVALSATFRHAATHARESLAAGLIGLTEPFEERVALHTCHRVEIVGVLRRNVALPDAPGVHVARGVSAAERTFLVTGGLDSAVLAEEQVLGQVRSAYERALAESQTGPILNELFRRALRFGKRVRSEVQPRNDQSLADRAVRWMIERLGPEARPASALVLGTGEMGRLFAHLLAGEGMTVTVGSRSEPRAGAIVDGLPNASRHRAAPLDTALRDAARHDVVAIAVRSASSPLDRQHLEPAHPRPLVVDLSAPPAVTAAAASILGDRLLDLDRLGALSSARPLNAATEHRLRVAAGDGAARFIDWWSTRSNGDGIALLRAHAAEIRERHLERLRRRPDLTTAQLAALEAATAAMLGELLHVPTLRLKRDPNAREVVARIFGIGP